MDRRSRRALAAALTVGWMVLAAGVGAAEPGQRRIVSGVEIYLGVLPAEMLERHPRTHVEGAMHGGVPSGAYRYHVLIALFDAKSGERITAADVTARVSDADQQGAQKRLEPMTMAGTISYGNYFVLPGPGPYRIAVEIRRPGGSGAIRAEFEYLHGRA